MKKKNIVPSIGLVTTLLLCVSITSAQAEFESSGNFFDDFDSDGDGVVSQGEYSGPDTHFSNLDSDGSGSIEADEGPTGPPAEHDENGGGPRGGGQRGDGPRGG